MTKGMLTLVAFLCVLTLSKSSRAVGWKFCFESTGDYSDNNFALSNGVREDYWKGDGDELIRGAHATIVNGGHTVFDDWLGDGLGTGDPGIGCTPLMPIDVQGNFSFSFTIDAQTYVQANTTTATRDPGGGCFRSWTTTFPLGDGTYTVAFHGVSESCNDVWRALNAASYGLYRHAGGMTGKSYNLHVGTNCSNTTNGNTVCLTATSTDPDGTVHHRGDSRKFTIIHEMGHALAWNRDSDLQRTGYCDIDDDLCPSDPDEPAGASHAMGSEERQVCAFQEAFSHFYAADVWNDHNETDCSFRYYKSYENDDGLGFPTVDCECSDNSHNFGVVDHPPGGGITVYQGCAPSGPLQLAGYMESEPCSTPWNAKGVEVDWMRVLWDVHTNGTAPPTFTTILDWAADSFGAFDTNIYSKLDARANTLGGSLNSNWDSAKTQYGIDH